MLAVCGFNAMEMQFVKFELTHVESAARRPYNVG